MAQERIENLAEGSIGQGHRVVAAAEDMAERASAYAQQQATKMSERAQSLATEAKGLLKEYTGRPLEAWAGDIRDYVRAHPLQIFVATIGVGYILGKMMKR